MFEEYLVEARLEELRRSVREANLVTAIKKFDRARSRGPHRMDPSLYFRLRVAWEGLRS